MDAFTLVLAAATPFDPSSILASAIQEGDQIEVTLTSPSTVTALPHEGAGWSEATQDVFGVTGPWKTYYPGTARLWLPEHGVPVDMRCWLAFTDGPISATSRGVALGLQGTTTGQQVVRAFNTGSSWTVAVASAKNSGTVGIELSLATIGASTSIGITVIDADGDPIVVTNTIPSSTVQALGTQTLDTMSVSCGWATGIGGTAGSSVRLRPLLAFLDPDAAWGGMGKESVFTAAGQGQLGQSNMVGPSSGTTDATWSGVAVDPADTVYRNGVLTATWPARPGPGPYLVEEIHAARPGAVQTTLRAVSGTNIATMLGSHIPNLVGDYYRFAPGTAPEVVVIVQGEADATAEATANAYEANLDLAVRRIHGYWPDARIVIQELVTTAAGYPYHATVRAAQHTVVDRYPTFAALSAAADLPTAADGVHLTPSAGGGYDQMAERIQAAATP